MKPQIIGMIAAALLVVTACSTDTETESVDNPVNSSSLGASTAASVNGEVIHESVLRLYSMNSLQRNLEQLNEDEQARMLDDLVQFKLLAQDAERRGMLDERRIAAELELQRLQLIARNVALRHLEENPATEAELRALYEEMLPQLMSTQYKARHILLDSEDDAREVIGLLDDGADFAELARDRSTGPTGPEGGDLGYFSPDSMVAPFSDAVRTMEAGTYSQEPVQTQFGWHVILVEDIREQEEPGLESVRADLERQLDQRKIEELVNSLREEAVVELD